MITNEELKEISSKLQMVSDDIEKDVADLEGKPFTGQNVAKQFGYLAAQVNAISVMFKKIIDDKIEEEK